MLAGDPFAIGLENSDFRDRFMELCSTLEEECRKLSSSCNEYADIIDDLFRRDVAGNEESAVES